MRWIRTFPASIPDGRSYVTDTLDRAYMNDYNYVPVFEQFTDDTVITEWDLAFGPETMAAFTAHIAADPGRVHVAPYRLYPRSTGLPEPVWAHRHAAGGVRWVSEGDPECDWFSFGLAYLPLVIVRAYLATRPERTGDSLFSRWHHETAGARVPVHWDVRPVHLHY
jgi:hypothetical protein